jgi:hypothetical protein
MGGFKHFAKPGCFNARKPRPFRVFSTSDHHHYYVREDIKKTLFNAYLAYARMGGIEFGLFTLGQRLARIFV